MATQARNAVKECAGDLSKVSADIAGLKTTCKDRWRQILNEGQRVPEKHLFTLQEAISSDQLIEMKKANVTLVVPKEYHNGYNTETGIRLLTVDGFIGKLKALTKPEAA